MSSIKPIGKRPRRFMEPTEKLKAIRRVHDGESKASVARDIEVPESTLRGWCKNLSKISTQAKNSSPHFDTSDQGYEPSERRSKFNDRVPYLTRRYMQNYNLQNRSAPSSEGPSKQNQLTPNQPLDNIALMNYVQELAKPALQSGQPGSLLAYYAQQVLTYGSWASSYTPLPTRSPTSQSGIPQVPILDQQLTIANNNSGENDRVSNNSVTPPKKRNGNRLDYVVDNKHLIEVEVHAELVEEEAMSGKSSLYLDPPQGEPLRYSSSSGSSSDIHSCSPVGSNNNRLSSDCPMTQEKAISHGDLFVEWVDGCSIPSIKANQVRIAKSVLTNLKAHMENNKDLKKNETKGERDASDHAS